MFFNKKNLKCESCKSNIAEEYSYCPYCGNAIIQAEQRKKDYGLLGNTDAIDEEVLAKDAMDSNMTFLDKLTESLIKSTMKAVEKDMRKTMIPQKVNPSVTPLPNGFKISIGMPAMIQNPAPQKKKQKKQISEEQLQKMANMPKTSAKSNVRRLSDKVVYELSVPGILSPEDVFISKLEQGYEIRAIGEKKVYVNSLPIELPIRGFSFDKNQLNVEFENK